MTEIVSSQKASRYTFSQIARILADRSNSDSPDPADPELVVERLLIDSRRLGNPAATLFIALEGPRHDGHDYVADLFDAGVRNFICRKPPSEALPGVNLLLVDDPLAALQELVAQHRSLLRYPVVGITGSNGKTVVKEWLVQLLASEHRIVRSPRSFNSQVGVPLSVWEMRGEHDLGIFEAGISLPGEMARIEPVIHPDIGIFTNLGAAHDEGFSDRMQKLAEKLLLFKRARVLICCSDQPQLLEGIGTAFGETGPELLTWSTRDPLATLLLQIGDPVAGETPIRYRWKENWYHATIPFTDAASIENAGHCLALQLHLGVKPERIAPRMATLEAVAMRMEVKRGVNRCVLINDTYSADLASLRVALEFAAQQHQGGDRIAILSDILQSGLPGDVLYSRVADLLESAGIRRLYAVGAEIGRNADRFSSCEARFFPDTEALLAALHPADFVEATVLVKGARSFRFERISRMLEEQAHGTVLEISLDALVHNLNAYRRMAGNGVRMMAMVKALSYGSGRAEVANALAYNRVDYLAVAYTDEGVLLRREGVTVPIMVMNPEPASFSTMLREGLEPELYSLRTLDLFLRAVASTPRISDRYSVHLKLDTGMHRLGFEADQAEALIARMKAEPRIHVASIFSHLAAAEDPTEDEFSRDQITRFEHFSNQLIEALAAPGEEPPLRHILNSAGIVRFPEACYDMVRVGIGLYGFDPSCEKQSALLPASCLSTRIAQLRDVAPGETIGYNRAGHATHPLRIATVNIGYADGLRRSLGEGVGEMSLRGCRVPIVGKVCMDMCMLDVSAVDGVREGDEVELFGREISLAEFAERMGTIPYEALTGLSERVKRVYTQELA